MNMILCSICKPVAMAVQKKKEVPSKIVIDRRRALPLFVLPALTLLAPPADAVGLGKDPRQLMREKNARKEKLRQAAEAMKAAGKALDTTSE